LHSFPFFLGGVTSAFLGWASELAQQKLNINFKKKIIFLLPIKILKIVLKTAGFNASSELESKFLVAWKMIFHCNESKKGFCSTFKLSFRFISQTMENKDAATKTDETRAGPIRQNFFANVQSFLVDYVLTRLYLYILEDTRSLLLI
jgi:hypothetical protein